MYNNGFIIKIPFLKGILLIIIIYIGFYTGSQISMGCQFNIKLFQDLFIFFPMGLVFFIAILNLPFSNFYGLTFMLILYLVIKQKNISLITLLIFFLTCVWVGNKCYSLLTH